MTTSPRETLRGRLWAARDRTRRSAADRQAVWRRGVLRKWLAAALAAAAVYAGITALAPPPPDPGPLVLVASSDLPIGTHVESGSVRAVHMPADLVPAGALTEQGQAVGSVISTPVRAGEILTDLRLSASAPLAGLDPDLVLAHLPLRDPQLAAVLRPGTRVDVLTTGDGTVLASDVLLAQRVTDEQQRLAAGATGAPVGFLVAVTPEQASRIAAGAEGDLPGAGLTVVIRS